MEGVTHLSAGCAITLQNLATALHERALSYKVPVFCPQSRVRGLPGEERRRVASPKGRVRKEKGQYSHTKKWSHSAKKGEWSWEIDAESA